jgi:hypothetical protein
MKTIRFPVLGALLLIFGTIWLMQDLGYININIPWIPVIVIVIAIGMIWNRFKE